MEDLETPGENNGHDVLLKDMIAGFVNTSKIAVAIAIIKTKPTHLTSEKYAQQLCSQYQRKQLHLEESNHRLEEEILELKQNLILQDMPPGSSVEEEMKPQVLTPPSSLEHQAEITHNITKTLRIQATLEKQNCFLQSMLKLQNMLNLQDPDTHICVHTMETCIGAVRNIRQNIFIDGQFAVSFPIIQHIIGSMVQLCDKSLQSLRNCVFEEVIHLIEDSIKNIMETEKLNDYGFQESVVKLITMISHSNYLRPSICEALLNYISFFSDKLRQMANKKQELDPCYFENIYYIFMACEEILKYDATKKEILHNSSSKTEPVLQDNKEKIDSSNCKTGTKRIVLNQTCLSKDQFIDGTVGCMGQLDENKSNSVLILKSSGNIALDKLKVSHTDEKFNIPCNYCSNHSFIGECSKDCNSHTTKSLLTAKMPHNLQFSEPMATNACDSFPHKELRASADRINSMKKLLEDSLLHISAAFPLFACYVWRLGAILDCSE